MYKLFLSFVLLKCKENLCIYNNIIGGVMYVTSQEGVSPLFMASLKGRGSTVDIILKLGADVNLPTNV